MVVAEVKQLYCTSDRRLSAPIKTHLRKQKSFSNYYEVVSLNFHCYIGIIHEYQFSRVLSLLTSNKLWSGLRYWLLTNIRTVDFLQKFVQKVFFSCDSFSSSFCFKARGNFFANYPHPSYCMHHFLLYASRFDGIKLFLVIWQDTARQFLKVTNSCL